MKVCEPVSYPNPAGLSLNSSGGGGSGAAYAHLSNRCRSTISADDYAIAVAQLKTLLKGTQLSPVTITTFAPPLARVSYHLIGSDDPRFTKADQPFSFEKWGVAFRLLRVLTCGRVTQ